MADDSDCWQQIEARVTGFLLASAQSLPKRWVRWLASYYPDARVRRACWQLTSVEMGEGTYANPGMLVVDDYQSGEVLVSFGRNVSIAPGVIIVAHSSPNNSKRLQTHPYVAAHLIERAKVVIEDDVWLGAHVVILPGIRVGCCSIIGAGAVVIEDVPPYSIVAGVPGRVVRTLEPQTDQSDS